MKQNWSFFQLIKDATHSDPVNDLFVSYTRSQIWIRFNFTFRTNWKIGATVSHGRAETRRQRMHIFTRSGHSIWAYSWVATLPCVLYIFTSLIGSGISLLLRLRRKFWQKSLLLRGALRQVFFLVWPMITNCLSSFPCLKLEKTPWSADHFLRLLLQVDPVQGSMYSRSYKPYSYSKAHPMNDRRCEPGWMFIHRAMTFVQGPA